MTIVIVVLFIALGFLTGGNGVPVVVLALLLAMGARYLWSLLPPGTGVAAGLVRIARFAWDFVVDLVVSNVRLAWDVLTPEDKHTIQLVEVPVHDLADSEVAFIAQRITLTPGTLSCGVSEDRASLLVHVMYPSPDGDTGRALRRPIDILKGTA